MLVPEENTIEPVREISLKTEKGEDVKIVIIHDMNSLSQKEKEVYAQSMEDISGSDVIPKEAGLSNFTVPEFRWYFLKDNKGEIRSYGRVSVEDKPKEGYIGTIATHPESLRKGFASTILDSIMNDGYDKLWAFNAIAGTPAGDGFRELHVRKGFVVDNSQPNIGPLLIWKK